MTFTDSEVMNLVSIASRLIGYMDGVGSNKIILDDNPQDYIDRIAEGCKAEAGKAQSELDKILKQVG